MPLVQAPNKPGGVRVNSNTVTIHLQANEKRRVAPHLALAAGAQGCFVLPDEDDDAPTTPSAVTPEVPTGDENELELPLGGEHEDTARHDLVVTAIRALMAGGNESAFTGTGRPRKGAVREMAGFEVSIDDINAAYDEIQAE